MKTRSVSKLPRVPYDTITEPYMRLASDDVRDSYLTTRFRLWQCVHLAAHCACSKETMATVICGIEEAIAVGGTGIRFELYDIAYKHGDSKLAVKAVCVLLAAAGYKLVLLGSTELVIYWGVDDSDFEILRNTPGANHISLPVLDDLYDTPFKFICKYDCYIALSCSAFNRQFGQSTRQMLNGLHSTYKSLLTIRECWGAVT